jgi:Glycosyl hydrolase family 36 C-terminal domain
VREIGETAGAMSNLDQFNLFRASIITLLVHLSLISMCPQNLFAQTASNPSHNFGALVWSSDSTQPHRFVSVHGRRAAVFGYSEDGLEVWAYPVQILNSYSLSFCQPGASSETSGRSLLRSIVYSPESVPRIYAGPDFIVRERIFVPIDEPGTIISYESDGTHPVNIMVHFNPVLDLMWPASIGGLEICNDGGRMVDFGSASHGDYFSITDTYDPLSNRRAFYDASFVLPSAMLESYVERWLTPNIENLRYMLRSGMMGWLTIMIDTISWNPERHADAMEELRVYKSELRPLIREADIYHISERPDGVRWDGMEYFDSKEGRGVVFAFRSSIGSEMVHSFLLKGLQAGSRYKLRFQDHTSADQVMKGSALMNAGVQVHLPTPNTSELIFVQELRDSIPGPN